MGLSLPGLALAHQLYVAVMVRWPLNCRTWQGMACVDVCVKQAQGHARLGTHSLMLALETLNGIPHAPRK
jgi:hypothetical protein